MDLCDSGTLSEQSNSIIGNITTRILSQDFSALSQTISNQAKLDIEFVETVVSSTGPVLAGLWESPHWQWDEWPPHVNSAQTEQDYYPWLEWVVFRRATHAVAAVRDRLHRDAGLAVPPSLRGHSTTTSIQGTTGRGTTDISHMVKEDQRDSHFTAHEVKRSRVLHLGNVEVLDRLVHLAGGNGGWAIRNAGPGLEEKSSATLVPVEDYQRLMEQGLRDVAKSSYRLSSVFGSTSPAHLSSRCQLVAYLKDEPLAYLHSSGTTSSSVIHIPCLKSEQGAVGIAGVVTAIYPIVSPGSYMMYGRSLPEWQ
ncbi:hypothetical protein C8R44DRAFT_954932 [Mycena epipterygia]|nr:hypothetical protein C8R44DRAFT_954932 [Mycena epipterygia]